MHHKFIQSLPSECRSAVLMSAPENAGIQEIMRRTQQFFDLDRDKSATKEVCFAVAPSSNETGLEKLTEQVLKLTEEVRGRPPYRTPPPQRRSRGDTRDSPYRHSDRSYSRSSRSQSRDRHRPRLICNYCEKPNHRWRECRKLKSDMKNKRGQPDRETDNSRPNNSDF